MANLSAEGVETVIQLKQKKGRQYLRDLLGWKEFDEVRDLRCSIQLDVHYRSLVFAAEKGLPWPAVAEVGKMTGEILEESKGSPISEAIKILQEKLSAFRVKLPAFQLRAVCDYFHNTFIKHYWLYQFVLARERDRHQRFASLEVYAPPQPLPLTEGLDLEVWKHQQHVAALSAAEDEKRAGVLRIREDLRLEKERLLQEVYTNVQKQRGALSKETLMFLVKEAIKTQIQSLRDIIQHEIEVTFEILQLKLQKKALTLNPPAPYPPPPCPEERGKKANKPPKKVQGKPSEIKDKGESKKKKKKEKKK
ncbi:uncharacterized protein C8orf74 homolog [Elgaria multicarinata webbii]|uniref:uncharacterized protein C8orf74 homolog n=1 Tax=Elgaria multicarinata webbii TaxID=159646 RepID=UPI002FCCF50F